MKMLSLSQLSQHCLMSHKMDFHTSVNLQVAAQPLPYFPLRTSHKQSNLCITAPNKTVWWSTCLWPDQVSFAFQCYTERNL